MSKRDNFLRDIERVDGQIANLQVYLYDAALYPEQIQLWPRMRRTIHLFLVRRHVTRQIQQLNLQRRGLRNCYVYLFKEEPTRTPYFEQRETADNPG
ncbi:hypothetical protein BH23ACT11_BH23ACT11_15880 [soil metagenome]